MFVASIAFAEAREIAWTSDKLEECLPRVQTSLAQLQQLDPKLHFTCKDGFLSLIAVLPGSAILSKGPEDYLESHWQLFFSTRPRDRLAFAGGNQHYKGFHVWNHYALRNSGARLKEFDGPGVVEYKYRLVDTSDWNFKPTKNIGWKEAVGLVRKFDENAGIKTGWEYHPLKMNTSIETSFCKGRPALVWPIRASEVREKRKRGEPRKNNQRALEHRTMDVDAETGKVCERGA